MSDITLVVSAPGPTVELTADAPGAVTVTVNEGGGVSTHAALPDLASSGHPASAIAFTPTGSIAATTVQAAVAEVASDAAAAYQPVDSDLTAIAALSTTAFGRAFLALADAAAGRTALGLGTASTAASGDFQPIDSDLTAIAALSTTSYGRAFLALADAATARTNLGLGDSATLSVGTTAGTVAAGDDSRITGAVPKSTVTTAGDLIYGTGNAAVSRLGIGSALQVLRTNAGATAPEWATVSSGAMSVIARTVVGTPASSVDFSSIPATYENLMVTFLARGSATGSEAIPIYARLNNDSGSNYGWHWSYATGNSGGLATGAGASAVTTMQVGYIADSSAETSHPGAGTLTIPGYARTVFVKAVQATWSFLPFYQYSNNKGRSGFASATWNNTAAVNQITLYPSAGNFVTGSVFTLYGIAGA